MARYNKLEDYIEILEGYEADHIRPGDIRIMPNPMIFRITSINSTINITFGTTISIPSFDYLMNGEALTSSASTFSLTSSNKYLHIDLSGNVSLDSTLTIGHDKTCVAIITASSKTFLQLTYTIVENFVFDSNGIYPIYDNQEIGSVDNMIDKIYANEIIFDNNGTKSKLVITNGSAVITAV